MSLCLQFSWFTSPDFKLTCRRYGVSVGRSGKWHADKDGVVGVFRMRPRRVKDFVPRVWLRLTAVDLLNLGSCCDALNRQGMKRAFRTSAAAQRMTD
jgi:hypothetical protein